MNCLNNFFGISQSCGQDVPTSGMYIDSLEGISVKSLATWESGKYLTAQNIIDEKTKFVANQLKETFSDVLFGDMVEHSLDSIVTRNFEDNFIEASNVLRGLLIEKAPTKLSSLFLERFYFRSAVAVTDLEVTVTDGFNPKVFEVTAAANEEVTIECGYATQQSTIRITYTSDTVEPCNDSIRPFTTLYTAGCHDCQKGGSGYIVLRGIDDDKENKTTYRGIRCDVSVICDTEKMLCLIAPQNKTAILYLVGAEILKECLAGDRINFLTINKSEWAQAKIGEWTSKAGEMFYNQGKGLKKYLEGKEKGCFICNTIQYGYSIP